MPDNDDQSRHWLGHSDTGMSPIVIVAMSVTRMILYFVAVLVAIVLALFLWEKIQIEGGPMARGDWGMLGVLTALVALPLFLARKIKAELLKGR